MVTFDTKNATAALIFIAIAVPFFWQNETSRSARKPVRAKDEEVVDGVPWAMGVHPHGYEDDDGHIIGEYGNLVARSNHMINLAGGLQNMFQTAETSIQSGNCMWASELMDAVLKVDPKNNRARSLVVASLRCLASVQQGAIARNHLLSRAKEIENMAKVIKNADVEEKSRHSSGKEV